MTTANRRIAGLDGLRAIAVLFVFLDHRLVGANVAYIGGYGVQIFFVLSGFLIVGMLHRDQLAIDRAQTTRLRAWRAFMIRRAGRILPLYYLLLILMALLSANLAVAHFSPSEMAIYAAFGTNFYFAQAGHWLGPISQGWSLAIEEQFYLIAAPLLLGVPARFSRPICIVVIFMAVAWHIALLLRYPNGLILRVDSLTNFGFIALGGVMALRPSASQRSLSLVLQPLLLAGLLLVPLIPHGSANVMIRIMIQPLIAASLFAEIRDHQDTWVVRLLEMRWLTFLGTISYGFYLLHKYVTPASLLAATQGAIDIKGWTQAKQLPLLFGLSVLAATASWYLIERPLLRRARHYAAHEPTANNSTLAPLRA